MRRITLVNAVGDALGLATNHRQRRSQLVHHVGKKGSPLLVARLEARRHRVERARHRPQLAWPGFGNRGRVVTAFDATGRVDQIVHRPREAPHPAARAENQKQEHDRHKRRHRQWSETPSQITDRDRAPDCKRERRDEQDAAQPPHKRGRATPSPSAPRRPLPIFRPPRRPPIGRRPPAAAHFDAGGSAKRYPTPKTVSR